MPITLWLLALVGSLGEAIGRQRLVVVGKELSKISKMRNCPIWPSGPPHARSAEAKTEESIILILAQNGNIRFYPVIRPMCTINTLL